jgi:26S proteasome regulatory subunit N8
MAAVFACQIVSRVCAASFRQDGICSDRAIVPFEEDDKDPSVWFLDHNFVESMSDMFKTINAREKLVGWYHSGPKLRASDLEINELFKRYTPNPLLVIVDVQPKEVGVPTDAYFAIEEIKDVSESWFTSSRPWGRRE